MSEQPKSESLQLGFPLEIQTQNNWWQQASRIDVDINDAGISNILVHHFMLGYKENAENRGKGHQGQSI